MEDKAKTEVDVIQIDERAVLVYLGTGSWTGTKLDKKRTAELLEDTGAVAGSAKVTKSLLPGADELTEIRKIVQSFRALHYQWTTAFGRDGWALLPSKSLGKYKTEFTDHYQRWQEAVERFKTKYPDLQAKAQTQLGSLYRDTDYPPVSEVIGRFKFSTDVRRIRESQNDLLGVSDELRKDIMDQADARVREGLEVTVRDLTERISKAVGNVVEVLGKSDGDKAPKVYDSLIENVKELAAEIPNLNVTGDKTFNKIADDMLSKLGKFETTDLRGSDETAQAARKEAKETAESILEDMNGIF